MMFTHRDAADVREREDTMHEAARRSLISVMLTAVIITANHLYVLGPKAFGLAAVLLVGPAALRDRTPSVRARRGEDRKSTRLNSSHRCISYAVFCLKK